jgi:hypothetical protein
VLMFICPVLSTYFQITSVSCMTPVQSMFPGGGVFSQLPKNTKLYLFSVMKACALAPHVCSVVASICLALSTYFQITSVSCMPPFQWCIHMPFGPDPRSSCCAALHFT